MPTNVYEITVTVIVEANTLRAAEEVGAGIQEYIIDADSMEAEMMSIGQFHVAVNTVEVDHDVETAFPEDDWNHSEEILAGRNRVDTLARAGIFPS